MESMRRTGVVLVAALAALLAAPLAGASFIVARNASHVSLRIQGSRAIVDYRAGGRWQHTVLWGAINARAPNPKLPQVAFGHRHGGGRLTGGVCRPYDGPGLPLLVVACKAPDGSYWALQAWQRLVPNYGGVHARWELHASHWRGPLPLLEVWQDWVYRSHPHVFGRLTYKGRGVHGFHSTPSGNPLDAYGRNLYFDTRDSAYGRGWRRENSFLAHGPGGTFCYGLYRHGSHPSGAGKEYRLTVSGPGVTPIVSWQEDALGAYDAATDRKLNAIERSLGDAKCRHG